MVIEDEYLIHTLCPGLRPIIGVLQLFEARLNVYPPIYSFSDTPVVWAAGLRRPVGGLMIALCYDYLTRYKW